MNDILHWRLPLAASVVCTLLFFSACEKREEIGLNLQDEDDLLDIRTIELPIQMQTTRSDSVITSGLTVGLLGDMTDPTYGRSRSSIYTSVRLSALSPDLGTDPVIDSLVLVLEFDEDRTPYGTSELTEYSVFRLEEAMSNDTTYYSNSTVPFEVQNLLHASESAFVPDPEEEVSIGDDTLSPQIRLRLDDLLGQELLDESLQEPSAFDGLEDFAEFFNGFLIQAENLGAQGAIHFFDLIDSDSRLELYYTNSEGSDLFTFSINSVSPRFLHFEHDYSGTPIEAILADPTSGEMENHVQAMAGLSVQVDLDDIRTLGDTGTQVINRVELILPADPSVNMDDTPDADRLFALYQNEDSVLISVPDLFEGDAHSGGFNVDSEYRINLTRFCQRVINDEISTSRVVVIPNASATSANFVKMAGPLSAEAARLEVTFTDY